MPNRQESATTTTRPSSPRLDRRVRLVDTLLSREIEGESVLLDTERGMYYGLDALGTRIVALLGESGDLRAVRRQLLAEYDVSKEQLTTDLLAFTEHLEQEGLIRFDDT